MARTLSMAALQAAYAPQTGDGFIVLLTLTDADLPAPIRVSSDAVDTVSRGLNFIALPFDVTLPDDQEDSTAHAQLSMDNVHREIVNSFRSISTSPKVLMELVTIYHPDVLEQSFPDFTFEQITYKAETVSGGLGLDDCFNFQFPPRRMDPVSFPGLH